MPDHRRHRGPHPEDQRLFAADQWPALKAAATDLKWLLSRDYAHPSSLKLVGDRYQLDARQRLAVARCAASSADIDRRHRQELKSSSLQGEPLWIDGYNVLTTIESALGQGVILVGQDGCYRDMASMHGTYRKVTETLPAIQLIGEALTSLGAAPCRWLLDQPVSNSGRLKKLLLDQAQSRGWPWQVELVPDPDRILKVAEAIVASSDSQIVHHAQRWFNLARHVIDRHIHQAWKVDLSS